MKKLTTLLTATLVAVSLSAQTPQTDEAFLQKDFLNSFHHRLPSPQALLPNRPLSSPSTLKASPYKNLPEDRVWFPGEWEQVKAVVVTPFYRYLVPGHERESTWSALPLVSGYAQYQQYSYTAGWQNRGIGPYGAAVDTASSFGKVFFYIMDGIQLGGAEAWVHVENPADSAVILRTLAQMNLRHDNLKFFSCKGNSFWYRDCGPICFYHGDQDSLAMLDFKYSVGRALDDSIPSYIHWQMGIPNYRVPLFWEGGNCLVDGAGMLVTSDAVYTNNSRNYGQYTWDGEDINTLSYESWNPLSAPQTKQILSQLIGQRANYILPKYHYDGGTGHIDLYADMYDENGFVFSQMPDTYSSWDDYTIGRKNIDSLCSYKSLFNRDYYTMATLPFPSKDNGSNFSSQYEYGRGYTRTYSNHTFVNNVILQPCFSKVGSDGMPTAAWDRANIEKISLAYPGYTIYCIDVREFDGTGGAIHCVTKQIPADNPIRILHKNIHGTMTAGIGNSNLPVSAIITNRSGIAHAEVLYRTNDSDEWQTLDLTPNGNRWYGHFPFSEFNTTIDSVDYYISATSNNGKTITKPMTANMGGYYHFAFCTDALIDSSWFDFDTTPIPIENITFTFGSNWATEENEEPRPLAAIEENSLEENIGQFYPNPASDEANLNINLGSGSNFDVTIIDQSGRTIHRSKLQTAGQIVYTINASRLATGIYNIVFSNGDTRIVRRLIVK